MSMFAAERAVAAALWRVAVAGDGAILGVALAICAGTAWVKYLASSSSLDRIRSAPSCRISELRSLLAASYGEWEDDGKLVVVRGQVQPTADSLFSVGSGERAVIVQHTKRCLYKRWKCISGWIIDLHALFTKSWSEQRSSSLRSVPFILVEVGQWFDYGYVHVKLDGSSHSLPHINIYYQSKPIIQPRRYGFFIAILGNGFPVASLDEEKIVAIGKDMTAIGKCRLLNGAFELKSCPDLPYFLSDKTKDEIEAHLASNSRILFWSAVILGAFSIGILGFTIFRNRRRWNEWRQRRQTGDESTIGVDVPEGQECVICSVRRKSFAFIPCGHFVCCVQCAIAVMRDVSRRCPICRQDIHSSIRLHYS